MSLKPHTAEFRFYEELNDFLPPERRKAPFPYSFDGTPSVKDAIEALGVPHTEIDLILVNGLSVGFGHRLSDGDRVAVYPVFESLDISPVVRLRPEPLREPKFILDGLLGRLAKYLRLLGFDTSYDRTLDDTGIIRIAQQEQRIILTRDRGLLKHGSVTHGYLVRSADTAKQAIEVVRRFDLACRLRPFSRCTVCNGIIEEVAKESVLGRIPPKAAVYYDRFSRCGSCGRIYWRGSHAERMEQTVHRLAALCKEKSG
jgi:uncharacterized protein with PIN domain